MFPKLKKYTKKYLSKNAVVKVKILRPRPRLGHSRPRPGPSRPSSSLKALNPRGQDQGHKFVSSRPRPVLKDYITAKS